MKNVIIFEKDRKKEKLSEGIVDKTVLAKVAWALSLFNLA